ncbi:MAG: hypothetical protein AAF589_01370 [Planctomycetota bacterium]
MRLIEVPEGPQAVVRRRMDGEAIKRAADLLSQQIWCWGQDILRPEGNWLLEIGFDRIAAPADRESCSSVYALEMPRGRRVVLRGFGVFYGDDRLGGVFLKRYEFLPKYTPQATLECPPWSSDDLPSLNLPTETQLDRSTSLTVGLIDWIRTYEENVLERLGIDYRQATLNKWESNKRPVVPAKEMVSSWRSLGLAVDGDLDAMVL